MPLLLNPAADRRRVWKKSNVRWEFIRAGLHTRHTIVILAWSRQPVLDPLSDLAPLGATFAIKPDLGGRGLGSDARCPLVGTGGASAARHAR